MALAAVAGAALAAFSLISGKQAHYLLPEMPALALMLAGGLPTRKWRRRDFWLALPLLAAPFELWFLSRARPRTRALAETDLSAEEIARRAMRIAAEICIYTNDNVVLESLDEA